MTDPVPPPDRNPSQAGHIGQPAVFCQTEMCDVLRLVKGSRCQLAQR